MKGGQQRVLGVPLGALWLHSLTIDIGGAKEPGMMIIPIKELKSQGNPQNHSTLSPKPETLNPKPLVSSGLMPISIVFPHVGSSCSGLRPRVPSSCGTFSTRAIYIYVYFCIYVHMYICIYRYRDIDIAI